ncbi:MAG: DegT/DnrJ/EryC1/StrS aminotransferase [Planctomycetaceae bacterium]|nr:DegT/DnrJ/EryC1/StrS aminotransferase [Planctomycetaceae bacterium]MBP63990.1 DegT/DnrJ/EryC1/StrS aminotransferase [Planctomycetaceae bacterium]
MYVIGEKEIEAVTEAIRSGKLFRYGVGNQCETFERRYAEFLGVQHVSLTSSGTNALTAAITAMGIGPGDEVLVPAHTYMATPIAVVSAGAIPVIVDIDESITISPEAVDDAVGPRTRAVIPVHMWGAACDMDSIMAVAQKHNLFVLEDACQAVGGGYEGRKLGSLGHMGAFSFNYYKNMTCGEGGAVVTNDPALDRRAKCFIDPCHFYWTGRDEDFKPFCASGSRASELEGAVLNAQLDHIADTIDSLRSEKQQILAATRHLADFGFCPSPIHSPDHDCATQVMYSFSAAESARQFVDLFPSVIAGTTGRHNYTEWDQILIGAGAAHPAMNPYEMEANRECRRSYAEDMCAGSLDILNRTVMIPTDPRHTPQEISQMIQNIEAAAMVCVGKAAPDDFVITNAVPVDTQKFDVQIKE